jgi:hypothetical protein
MPCMNSESDIKCCVALAERFFLATSSSLRVCSATTRLENVGQSVGFLLQQRTMVLQNASRHSQVTSFDSPPPPSHELNHPLIVCDFGVGYVAQRQQFPGEYAKGPHVARLPKSSLKNCLFLPLALGHFFLPNGYMTPIVHHGREPIVGDFD